MNAWYNENDPKAAAWLRELIAQGHIAPGVVDERSIEDVRPSELAGYTQCHFFAGIGGWSYALRLAGWPDDRPVWTGSCPCQPFSAAGKGKGFDDERHLWPAWFHLIRECKPERVFGEQVANAMQWVDLVQRDLEAEGYACGYTVLGAHSVGAPHIRQRLYWMADTNGRNTSTEGLQRSGQHGFKSQDGSACELADAMYAGRTERRSESRDGSVAGSGSSRELGHSDDERSQGRRERGNSADQRLAGPTGVDGFWSACDWLPCRDGKARPVEPGTFPLAHGVPGRVVKLRGYGNAIVPQVAAAFIQASELI